MHREGIEFPIYSIRLDEVSLERIHQKRHGRKRTVYSVRISFFLGLVVLLTSCSKATWVGINDLAFVPARAKTLEAATLVIQEIVDELFTGQEKLYEAGARNFLFIGVPPVDRSPACKDRFFFLFHALIYSDFVVIDREVAQRREVDYFSEWNRVLQQTIRKFVSDHDAVTAIYFSSYKVFTSLLDNPQEYGLPPEDVKKYGGAFWIDHLHPTTAVHKIVAEALVNVLSEVKVQVEE